MPLTIKPEPDTTIRVLMEYKGLENSIKVEEQSLCNFIFLFSLQQ